MINYHEEIEKFFTPGFLGQRAVYSEADVCARLKEELEKASPNTQWFLELTVPILDEQLGFEKRPTSDLVLPSVDYLDACGEYFFRISKDIAFRREHSEQKVGLRQMLDRDCSDAFMANCAIEVKFMPYRDMFTLRTGLAKDFNTLNLWQGLAKERVVVLVAVEDNVDQLIKDEIWPENGEKDGVYCVAYPLKESYKIV